MVIDESEKFFPDRLVLRLHTDAFDLRESDELMVSLCREKGLRNATWEELDSSVDVIALELNSEEVARFVLHAFTPIDLISSELVVGVGDPLLVIGYPRGFSDDIHNLPIFRQATVASVYPVPFGGKPYFLIDSDLHPGTSGSPVITQPSLLVAKENESELFEEPQYRLIGIHSASYDDLKLNVVWFADLLSEICERAVSKNR